MTRKKAVASGLAVLGVLAFLGPVESSSAEVPLAACKGTGKIHVRDLPSIVDPSICDLDGRELVASHVGVVVPLQSGVSVLAHATAENGEYDLYVRKMPSGEIKIEFHSHAVPVQTDGGGGGATPCNDNANNDEGFFERDLFEWRLNVSTLPSHLPQAASIDAMREGIKNITHGNNNCDLPDTISATSDYLGGTTRTTDIGAGGGCLSRDGVNVADFNPLNDPDTLAVACQWWFGADLLESDVRMDSSGHGWTNSPAGSGCSGSWDIEGVMTHERGHTYGLAHVNEPDHGQLTMSVRVGPCEESQAARTLGLGDMIGLHAKY